MTRTMRPMIPARRGIVAKLLIVLGASALSVGLASASTTYNAFVDFSGTTNPSPDGIWQYGYSSGLGSSFNLYLAQSFECSLTKWQIPGMIPPVVEKNETQSDIHCYGCIFPTSEFISLHPGPNGEYSVLRWTAPSAATWKITAIFKSLRSSVNTTTDVHLLHNSVPVQSSYVDGTLTTPGVDLSTTLTLDAGDFVDFAVGDGGNGMGFDTTGLKAIIELAVPVLSCTGFHPPMANYPVRVKGTRALPLKANLWDAEGYEITDLELTAPPVIQVWFQSAAGEDLIDVTDDALPAGMADDGNQCYYDVDGQWHFNLKTSAYSSPGTYTVTLESGEDLEYLIEPTCETQFVIK